MEGAIDRELAAETLRSVEGLRRRTISESVNASPFPLFVFGLAALVAAPFGFTTWQKAVSVALAVTLFVAVVVTELHYRNQAVHPGPLRKKAMSTAEAIILAAVIIFVAPMLIGIFLILATVSSGGIGVFLAFTAFAILIGRRERNGALALVGGFSLFAVALAPFTWNDHWQAVAALMYAGAFLATGFVVRAVKAAA